MIVPVAAGGFYRFSLTLSTQRPDGTWAVTPSALRDWTADVDPQRALVLSIEELQELRSVPPPPFRWFWLWVWGTETTQPGPPAWRYYGALANYAPPFRGS